MQTDVDPDVEDGVCPGFKRFFLWLARACIEKSIQALALSTKALVLSCQVVLWLATTRFIRLYEASPAYGL